LLPPDHIERHTEPVAFVPWCASASETLSQLSNVERRVAVVLNELGETIGIVPIETLLDAVLRDVSRPDPADAHAARFRQVTPFQWEASGATPLRKVAKRLTKWIADTGGVGSDQDLLDEAFLAARSRTIGGLIQELLERAPRQGDQVEYGGLEWNVISGPTEETNDDDAPLVVRIEPGSLADQQSPIADQLPGAEGGPEGE
jgi:CBS domain containing-hemolysin-like protein